MAKKKEVKFYTKIRFKNTELYFDTLDRAATFITLLIKANKNIEFVEFAESNAEEFLENTTVNRGDNDRVL